MSSPAQHVSASAAHAETRPLRFVTAASLFDGHDAAINIMRRIIQAQGAEVIHLGHNRSVEDVVRAALQEDADAIGLSILSGAHMTQFGKVLELLAERDATDITVFGGGIIPDADIAELERMGVAKIFTPGAATHEIVDWVKSSLGQRHPA